MTIESSTTFMFRLSYSFDYKFCIVIFPKKFLAEGHIFGCIKSMLSFTEVDSVPHKEQC